MPEGKRSFARFGIGKELMFFPEHMIDPQSTRYLRVISVH